MNQSSTTSPRKREGWLIDGGETGRLIAATDWSQTPLGPIDQWSQTLRTSVGIMLACCHPMFIWWGEELTTLYNDALLPALGNRRSNALGISARDAWPEIREALSSTVAVAVGRTASSCPSTITLPFLGNEESAGYSFSLAPIVDEEEGTVGFVGSFAGVPDNVAALANGQPANLITVPAFHHEDTLRAEAETLNEVAQTLASELDLEALLQKVTDSGVQLTGAQMGAFFRTETGEDGSTYVLFTLSGAPREVFEKLGAVRFTPLFSKTFSGEAVLRIDDVVAHPLYGKFAPHYGMPPGHLPVRSYLAVPVRSRRGDVLGGLFFGHREVGVFSEQAERLAVGIAAHAAIAIDNARLYGEARKELEDRVRAEQALRTSEERFRALSMNAPAAIFIKDREGRYIYTNALASQALGKRDDEVGYTDHDVLSKEVADTIRQRDVQVLTTGKVFECEDTVARPGYHRDYLSVKIPLRDHEGRVEGLCGVAIDITERRNAEAARAHLAAIVESSEDPIISKTLDGTITSWNRGAQRVFGYTAEEVIGKSITMLIPPERRAEEKEILERLRRGQSVEHHETVRIRKDGTPVELSLAISPVKNDAGEIIGASKIARDISQRKQAERALRESERRFRTLADNAPVLIWMSDQQKAGEYFNKTWCDFTGKPMDDHLGEAWLDCVHPDDREPLIERCLGAFRKRKSFTTQFRLRRSDGEYRWMLDTGAPRFSSDGSFAGFIGTCLDITDNIRAEEKLRESEKRYRQLVQGLPAGVYTTDAEGRIKLFNEAAVELWGREPELDRDKWCGSIKIFRTDGTPLPIPDCPMAVALREGRSIRGEEIVIERPDGIRRNVLANPQPIYDEEGNITGAINMLVDITDRRLAEQAQRDAAERLKAVINTAVDGIITIDSHGIIETVNPSTTRLFGYEPEEIIGQNISMLMPQPYSGEHDGYLQRYQRTGDARIIGIGREVQGRRKDGTVFPLDLAVSETKLAGRLFFTGIVRDVSERKKAEQAQREATERLKAVINTAVDSIITIDTRGNIGTVNPATTKLFGYEPEEMVGKNVSMLMPQPYSGEHDGYLRSYLTTGDAKIIGIGREVEGRRKDGTVFPLELAVSESRLDGSVFFTGIVRDVSARKLAEQELRESEERFRTMADAAPVLIWQATPNKHCDYFNKAWLEFTGRTMEDELYTGWIEGVHTDDLNRWKDVYNAAFDNREPFEVEYRLRHRSGEFRWILAHGVPRFAGDGTFMGYIGGCIEIDDRRKTEDALRQSEERFRMMADNIAQLAWMADELGVATWYNKRWYDYTGTTLGQMRGRGWEKCMHPDHLERVNAKVQRCMELGVVWEDTFPIRGKDGDYRWFLSRAVPIYDTFGRIVRWFGTNTDITDRRAAEDALRESEERFRLVAQATDDALWDFDLRARRVWWSDECTPIYGEKPPRDKSAWEWRLNRIHEEDRAAVRESIHEAIENREDAWQAEYRIVQEDGTIAHVLDRAHIAHDERGKPVRILGAILDLTERKQAEVRLRFLMSELNHRVKNVLGTVQATARQTLRSSSSLEHFSDSFEQRLTALAHVHSLLTRADWEGSALDDLVRSELEPRVGDKSQVDISGPPVVLRPKAAMAVHMVMHELCTNAAKYGALSASEGKVVVHWRLDSGPEWRTLQIEWKESNGPPVSPPKRRGFGSEVLEETIEYELDGEVNLAYPPSGVVCDIRIPWTSEMGFL